MDFKELRDALNLYLFVSDKVGNTILDVSCGRGYGAYIIAPFHLEVLGVDSKKENMYWAKKHLKNENLNFEQSAHNEIHKFGTFDAVVLLDSKKKFVEPKAFFNYLYYLFDKCVLFGGKLVFDYPIEWMKATKIKFLTQNPVIYAKENIISITKDFRNPLRNIRL